MQSCHIFKAEVLVHHHYTTIKEGYEAIVNVDAVSQRCKLVQIISIVNRNGNQDGEDDNVLRSRYKAIVLFKFMYRPEHILVNQRFMLREGRVKISGLVLETNK